MKYLLNIFIFFCFAGITTANAQFLKNNEGRVVTTKDYTDIDGSPYLYDNWLPGTVKLSNGQTYKDVMLKYDLLKDEVLFKGKDDEMLAFVQPVTEFTIAKTEIGNVILHFKKGFTGLTDYTANAYFEVLADGGTQLLKKLTKTITESQQFNSATKTRNFADKITYYIVKSSKITWVKNDKKAILAALANKQPQLEAYLKTNKVDFKNDDDLGRLVTYYNSL
jgi:hypothetical protein